ncbi:MAG TPA: DUF1800 domain-containing protein, partial [Ktedonobacterales bacterium]|nr:DUF1800 domain-containing protein [Ktedonobacterales bacterium]
MSSDHPPYDPQADATATQSSDRAIRRASSPGGRGQWPGDVPTLPPTVHLASGPSGEPSSSWQPPTIAAPAASPPHPGGTPPQPQRGVSRRNLLIGVGAGAVGVGAAAAGLTFFLSMRGAAGIPNVFASDAGQISHLLRRAGFGPSPADIGDYLSAGVSGTIDRLLDYTDIHDDLDQKIAALNLDLSTADGLVRWWVLRMIYSRRPLEEKLTLFWHGVLTSSITKVGGKRGFPLMVQQNNLLRQKAMGRFDDLVAAISTDPAMLHWLDGNRSTGRSPNENYARELMELFTMGVGNYTQDDVHQGALALTGWAIQGGKGVFIPARHFNGSVTFLGHTGQMGLSEVVKLVCAHPATGKHLAYRMWSFFVAENPSDADLKPLADAYYRSNHSIRAMVEAMLKSPALLSPQTYRSRVKSPLEFAVGAVRGLGLSTDAKGLTALLAAMGQIPFDPPDVSGWPGDTLSAAWVSTGSWITRVNLINSLVAAASGIGSRQ